jgi:TolA-binding protein
MNPAALKPVAWLGLVLLLVLLSVGATWQVQDWRWGQQLAQQAASHQADLTTLGQAAAAQVRANQDQRLALEQRLARLDQTHHQELSNEQAQQARLRDRLATAALRLSVLVAAPAAGAGGDVSAPAGTGGVVHAAARAELDRAAAQRIVAIAGDGDAGLIALSACQAYVREVSGWPAPKPDATGSAPRRPDDG